MDTIDICRERELQSAGIFHLARKLARRDFIAGEMADDSATRKARDGAQSRPLPEAAPETTAIWPAVRTRRPGRDRLPLASRQTPGEAFILLGVGSVIIEVLQELLSSPA